MKNIIPDEGLTSYFIRNPQEQLISRIPNWELVVPPKINGEAFSQLLPHKIFLKTTVAKQVSPGRAAVISANFAVPALVVVDEEDEVLVKVVKVSKYTFEHTLEINPFFRFNPYLSASPESLQSYLDDRRNIEWTPINTAHKKENLWNCQNQAVFFRSPIGILNSETWRVFWAYYTQTCKETWNKIQ